MAIIYHDSWDLSERGKKDAARHREKIDETIRKNVRDVISEESIITKREGKKVRIPVKGLKDFKFIYDYNGHKGGIGQGEGDPGDIIGRRVTGKGKDDNAGDQLGDDYLETEVDIDYLIKIMFEDLGLPWIEEKTKKQQLVPKGWKFETISRKGIIPRVHKKKTIMEAMKRTISMIGEIMNETGCEYEEGRRAILQTKGDIDEAIKIIKNGKLNGFMEGIYINDDDLRFKQIEEAYELHSRAVVIAMMDVSGSMTIDKKYLARSMLFWMVEFLKKVYDNVEIRFIQHTTEAALVDEDTFFRKAESGGTKCASAFELANHLIDTEYPVEEWNVYCMYNSDGDDWDVDKTISEISKMLDKKINMLGYTEICPENRFNNNQLSLMSTIKNKWNFKIKSIDGSNFYKNEDKHFLLARIRKKEDIWNALKHFLFEKDSK